MLVKRVSFFNHCCVSGPKSVEVFQRMRTVRSHAPKGPCKRHMLERHQSSGRIGCDAVERSAVRIPSLSNGVISTSAGNNACFENRHTLRVRVLKQYIL